MEVCGKKEKSEKTDIKEKRNKWMTVERKKEKSDK